MCLLIFSPDIRKSKIDIENLKRGFERNDDGAGLAYVRNGKVVIDKGYFKFASFKNAYERIARVIEGPLMIHFRLATSGKQDYQNCHPMPIYEDELCVGHNGIFGELSCHGSDISDTVKLSNLIRDLQWTFPFTEAQETVIDMLCGFSNKLVFLDKNGDYLIINEKQGTWRDDTWYSNTLSFPYIPTQTRYHPSMSQYPSSWQGKAWDELTQEEIEAFCTPDDNAPIEAKIETVVKSDEVVTVLNEKELTITDQDKKILEYMDKYPNLFHPDFKAKRLARIKASSVLKKMPLALPAGPHSIVPPFCPLRPREGEIAPINDPTSQFYQRGPQD